jgi:hypothetical protein
MFIFIGGGGGSSSSSSSSSSSIFIIVININLILRITCYLITGFLYVKFVDCNFKCSRLHHIFNHVATISVSYVSFGNVYVVFSYYISRV